MQASEFDIEFPFVVDLGSISALTGSGNENLRDNPGSIIPRYTDVKLEGITLAADEID